MKIEEVTNLFGPRVWKVIQQGELVGSKPWSNETCAVGQYYVLQDQFGNIKTAEARF